MISVCMATYNGARFIKQQIDSILPQLSENDELIISDDGSSDGTLEIIESYHDKRITVLNHTKTNLTGMYHNFRHVTENFENALNQAQGDFIFLSDQDDVWKPNKIERCVKLLEEYDCVVHNYQVIDINGNVINERNYNKNPIHKTIVGNVANSHFRGCCMAFNKYLLKYILPIPKKVIGHDYWIGNMANHYGRLIYELDTLIQYRCYAETVSAYRKNSLWYKIRFRVQLLSAIIQRILHKQN